METGSANLHEEMDQWIVEWGNPIVRYAYTLVQDLGLAQDIAQETFLKLYQFRQRSPDAALNSGWLFRVAHNLAVSQLRKKREVPVAEVEGETGPLWPDRETRTLVSETLGQLSPRDQACLMLFYFGGYSSQEIAREMQLTPEGVRTLLSRARRRFKTIWQGENDDAN